MNEPVRRPDTRHNGLECAHLVRRVGTTAGPAKQLIGFVPQDVALYPDLSVRENLRFFGRLYRLSRRELERRVDEVLDLIDVHAPTLLVLDEPTVGVDPQSRHAILESVNRFGEEGLAVLYTTHYMEEVERLCDRVGIIDRGRTRRRGHSARARGAADRTRPGAAGRRRRSHGLRASVPPPRPGSCGPSRPA